MAKAKIKRIPNTLVYHDNMSDIDIIFCYGTKAHADVCLRFLKEDQVMHYGGLCTHIDFQHTNKIIIGIKTVEEANCNYLAVKALLVHEMSHAVTFVMKIMNINDDEYRSYLLQRLYLEFVDYLDTILFKEEKKNAKLLED